MFKHEEKTNKLKDIENIVIGDSPDEIIASLEILTMLIEIDDEKDVLMACKRRLAEGIQKLKEIGFPQQVIEQFDKH